MGSRQRARPASRHAAIEAPVEAATRAAKVEALSSWSASSTSARRISSAVAASSDQPRASRWWIGWSPAAAPSAAASRAIDRLRVLAQPLGDAAERRMAVAASAASAMNGPLAVAQRLAGEAHRAVRAATAAPRPPPASRCRPARPRPGRDRSAGRGAPSVIAVVDHRLAPGDGAGGDAAGRAAARAARWSARRCRRRDRGCGADRSGSGRTPTRPRLT